MPAPDLLEVARTWWDVDRVPVVVWDAAGRRFELIDADDRDARLGLVTFVEPVADPEGTAATLAEAFAACDFPPNGDGVPPDRAARSVRAHGIVERVAR